MVRMQIVNASVSVDLATSLDSKPFPIGLANNEVMILHSSKLQIYSTVNSVSEARIFLHKKTENVPTDTPYITPAGDWQEDDSLIDVWLARFDTTRTAEEVEYSKMYYQNYPIPIILIRPPSMLFYGTASVYAGLTLWYHVEKVSPKTLVELMVKDHA